MNDENGYQPTCNLRWAIPVVGDPYLQQLWVSVYEEFAPEWRGVEQVLHPLAAVEDKE